MTRLAHPASFLAFATDVETFVEEVEAAFPATIACSSLANGDPLVDAAMADAAARYGTLAYVLTIEERARIEAAGVAYQRRMAPYLENVAMSRHFARLAARGPRTRSERQIQVDVIAGVHFVTGKDRACTARQLNRGIPRMEMAYGFTPSLVRNAICSFDRSLSASASRLVAAVDLAAAKALALFELWQDIGGVVCASQAAEALMANGQILPMYRACLDRGIRSCWRDARADAADRMLVILQQEVRRRCETPLGIAG